MSLFLLTPSGFLNSVVIFTPFNSYSSCSFFVSFYQSPCYFLLLIIIIILPSTIIAPSLYLVILNNGLSLSDNALLEALGKVDYWVGKADRALTFLFWIKHLKYRTCRQNVIVRNMYGQSQEGNLKTQGLSHKQLSFPFLLLLNLILFLQLQFWCYWGLTSTDMSNHWDMCFFFFISNSLEIKKIAFYFSVVLNIGSRVPSLTWIYLKRLKMCVFCIY